MHIALRRIDADDMTSRRKHGSLGVRVRGSAVIVAPLMRTRDDESRLATIGAALVLCTLPSAACHRDSGDVSAVEADPEAATAGETDDTDPLPSDASDSASDSEDETTGADATGGSPTDTGSTDDPGPGDVPDDAFLDGFFPIGVFAPLAPDMQGWKDLGLNTMLSVPQGEDRVAWDETAQSLGLAMIRQPLPDPAADVGRTDLLAWLLPDEPDIAINDDACGGSCVDLTESLSSQWRAIDPARQLFVNLAGPNVLMSAACDHCNGPGDEPPNPSCIPDNDQCYPRIIDAADWISEDIYPVTGWLPSEDLRDDITVVGKTLDRIGDWTDKPQFAIIEASDLRHTFDGTGTRGPTPDEVRAEVWHAIIHGARGIFYFPVAFNPFEFDAVEDDVKAEIAVQHALLAEIGPVLQTEIDPSAMTVAADAPLESTWRLSDTEAWVVVLNTTNAPVTARVSLGGVAGDASVVGEDRTVPLVDGVVADDFGAYAVHVYRLPRG
jgi:hypothetical protein